MKNYYTLKEIILGLKNEQLYVIKKLKELEKYINVNEKHINPHLNLQNYEQGLTYTYTEKTKVNLAVALYNTLQELLYNGKLNFKTYVKNIETKKINENSIYINEKEKFTEELNNLFNDETIRAFYELYGSYQKYLSNTPLKFDYDFTKYYDYKGKGNISWIYYLPEQNKISTYTGKFSNEPSNFINRILDEQISKSAIPKYFQNAINENLDTKKEIVVPNTKILTYNPVEFYLNEELSAYVLTKKK